MSNPRFALVTPPTAEPVSFAAIKHHAKIEIDDDNALLDGYSSAARIMLERATGRAFAAQTWTASLNAWPCVEDDASYRAVRLANFPLIAITSVLVDGVALASTLYRLRGNDLLVSVDADDSDGELDDEIVITYTCGYALTALPEPLRLAIKMLATHFYEARGATSPQGVYHQVIPFGVDALILPYKVLDI